MRIASRFCALLAGLAVLITGCSQSSSSSQSSSLPTVSSSSASSEAPQSSSQPIGGIDPEFTISEAIRPTPWWQELIEGDLSTLTDAEIKLYDNISRISVSTGADLFSRDSLTDLTLIADSAKKASESVLGDTLEELAFFEILTGEDIKYTGYLFDGGIALTRSIPGQNTTDPIYLSIDERDYALILERMTAAFSENPAYPSWLALMRLSRCTDIIGYYADEELSEEISVVLEKDSAKCTDLFRQLQKIPVEASSAKVVTNDTRLTNARTLLIGFDNEIQYRVQTDGKSLLVASSDMGSALRYTIASGGQELYQLFDARGWNVADNPMTA